MAIIKSGASSDTLTIGATSKAAYVNERDSRGNDVGMKTSYSATTTAKTAAAAGTTVFAQIFGSGTKTIRIQRIIVCGVCATAAIYGDVIITKRTAVGSGGTPVTLTQMPKDSNSAAGTATVVKFFTAAPSAGTGGGTIATQMAFMPVTGTPATIVQPIIFDWTTQGMNEAPVLRGTGEGLELSFGTTTTNAPTLTVQFEWTEE